MKETKKESKTSELTQERLKELLEYESETGVWVWRVARSGTGGKGSNAGCVNADGYRYVQIDGVLHKSSRLAFLYMDGSYPHEVDHKNRIRHDDRWENLRGVTRQGNIRNRGVFSSNSSGITGVYFHKQRAKWAARIMINGKLIHLGLYEDFKNAVFARYCGELQHNWAGSDSNTSAKKFVDQYLNRN